MFFELQQGYFTHEILSLMSSRLHSSMIYLIVYKKIAYYKQQLLPTPRGWRYFTFGREVKIRRGVILRLWGWWSMLGFRTRAAWISLLVLGLPS